ncbi:MAG: hypothetical protein FJ012_11005 [Chloroflexi bacterium]|nr:hypothetical protein [Chloroflexota bacterium]
MITREYLDNLVEQGKIQRGVINGFRGSWSSGLGYLIVDGIPIPCDNAPTVRALDVCFGDVIAEGHTVNQAAIIGKEVYWSMDGFVLRGFTPVRKKLGVDEEVDTADFGAGTQSEMER